VPLALLAGLASGLASCGEPTTLGPPHTFQLIHAGDTVAGRLPAGGGEVRYAFPAQSDSIYAVFLQSKGGRLLLEASDTARSVALAALEVDPGPDLLEQGTLAFTFGTGPVLVTVSGAAGGAFRLFVYQVHEGPERRPARFAMGDTVSETLETLADIDTFVVSGSAGQEVIGYVQGLDPTASGFVSLDLETLASASGTGGDSDLQQEATGRIVLPATRDYRALVQSSLFPTGRRLYRGAYRFQLRPVNRAPEHVPAPIQPGDTVAGEAIDYVGDIDEFTLSGAPGQECNVFFQALSGTAATQFELVTLDSSGQPGASVRSGGADPGLLGQATGRLRLPLGGTIRLRVSGVEDRSLADRGAYRIWVYPVNRLPEGVPDSLPFGDSVSVEAIDIPGDVDEYKVTAPDSSGANLVAMIGNDAIGGALGVSLLDSTGTVIAGTLPLGAGDVNQTGPLFIAPGRYVVRVEGFAILGDARSAFRGSYGVWLYRFRAGPETAPDTIAVGDTIAGEAIDPPGDVDQFHFFGRRGDHVNIAFSGAGAPGQAGFSAELTSPGGDPMAFLGSPLSSDSLGSHQSNRLDLIGNGWYSITISAGGSPIPTSDKGPYRLAVTRFGTAPEHAAPNLTPGDAVTSEAIDFPGDWDEFTVIGTPGELLDVLTGLAAGPVYPVLSVFDSSTGATLAWTVPREFDKATGRFTMPPSGRLKIAVYSVRSIVPTCFDSCAFGFVGGYHFSIVSVNPLPEDVPASFALGDTVRGEGIFPAADLDEFTSTATPGDTLAPWYRLPAAPSPAGSLITLEVVDPATGAVLAGSGAAATGPSTQFFSPGAFVVPASGIYRIRVRSYYDDLGTAPYEFFVAPVL